MQNGKYLFFDMDGTLISHDTRKIPDSTIEALRLAQANGHHCFLCTGRSLQMSQEFDEVIQLPGTIFCNGGGIALNGNVLETHDISDYHVKEVIHLCEMYDGRYQLLTTAGCFQNEKQRASFYERFKNDGYTDEKVKEMFVRRGMVPMSQYHNEPVQKIDIHFEDDESAAAFFEHMPKSLNAVFSGGYYAGQGIRGGELTASSISKGYGIRRVLEMFSASTHDAYGFGDSSNDIEMLRTCGTGIAMGNGSEECKKSADYITRDVNHDGIYEALKYFDLI